MKRILKLLVSALVRGCDLACAKLLRVIGRRPPATCVVLYYHGVEPRQREKFAAQLDTLARSCEVIPADATRPLNPGRQYAMLTFDDGLASVLENALPALSARGLPFAWFITTGCLGGCATWVKDPAKRRPIIPQTELLALKSHPLVTIGSHTVTHPRLAQLDDPHARQELHDSKTALEALLGAPVTLLSFPHGSYNARTLELAWQAGYERAFTIEPRTWSGDGDSRLLGRVLADPDDWPLEFQLKLHGAYRWLARRPLQRN